MFVKIIHSNYPESILQYYKIMNKISIINLSLALSAILDLFTMHYGAAISTKYTTVQKFGVGKIIIIFFKYL